MKTLIVAVCSWPLTELYWNITARYEFPFFVTVVALLWVVFVEMRQGRHEPVEVHGDDGSIQEEMSKSLQAFVNQLRDQVAADPDQPFLVRARVVARGIIRQSGYVTVDMLRAECTRLGIMAPVPGAWGGVFDDSFAKDRQVPSLHPGRRGKLVWRWVAA